jgi:hypothetical protein
VVGDLLLPAAERLVDDRDRLEPLHVGHAVPARHHDPQREAVLRRERAAVDLVSEQHLVAKRVGERQASFVQMLDVVLDAAIEPGEDDLDTPVEHSGLLEDRGERRARPFSGADGLREPRLADRARS